MDPVFDPAGPTMSSSLQPVTTNREVFNAKELNDSILGVNLSSENSELLRFYHKREHESNVCFTENSVESRKFVYCHNVERLLLI